MSTPIPPIGGLRPGESAARLDEARFVREHDRLDAIAQSELREDVGKVGAHRRVGDEEGARDLGVRQTARDQREHLELSLGQLFELGRRASAGRWSADEVLDQTPHQSWRQERVARRHGSDGSHQLIAGHVSPNDGLVSYWRSRFVRQNEQTPTADLDFRW